MGLDLRERHLDGIEVRAVWRQEHQAGTGCFNGEAHRWNLVGGQVVHDDDIPGPQGRDQNLFDIGEEGGTSHGAVQRHGRGDAGQPEAANEGCRFRMTMRHWRATPLAPRGPAIHPGHLGRCAAFINKDKLFRVEIRLTIEPGLTTRS